MLLILTEDLTMWKQDSTDVFIEEDNNIHQWNLCMFTRDFGWRSNFFIAKNLLELAKSNLVVLWKFQQPDPNVNLDTLNIESKISYDQDW